MHYGIAALWGMRALVRKDTVAAGQISEPAVTDQKDLGQHSSCRRPVFFIVSVSPRKGSLTVWGRNHCIQSGLASWRAALGD